jgi:DNA-binding NarL/FixJ family response regulator
VRIVLGDGQQLLLEAMTTALGEVGHEVVARTPRPEELAGLVARHAPDACVLEVVYAGRLRLDAVRAVRRTQPGTSLLAMTADAPAAVWDAVDEGVLDGLVSKASSFSAVHAAIRAAVQRQPLVTGFRRPTPVPVRGRPHQDPTPLTQREREVLQMLAQGLSTRAIATRLSVSHNTVRTHVANVLRKLSVHDRGKAVSSAVELGILDGAGR